MEFVRIENTDGDVIYASLYPDTNHPGFDVQLFDETSGRHWPVQLKATDDVAYVQRWLDQHPDGEILVTNELADRLGLEGSGVENGQLTTQVEEFVDQLMAYGDTESLSSYFPALAVVSSALVIWELWQRYRRDEISYSSFRLLALMATGGKVAKIGVLVAAMSIPGLNVVVGTALVARLIYSSTEFASERFHKLHIGGLRNPEPA